MKKSEAHNDAKGSVYSSLPELTKYLKGVMPHLPSNAGGDVQEASSQCYLLDAKGKPDYSFVGRKEGGISAACFEMDLFWPTYFQFLVKGSV